MSTQESTITSGAPLDASGTTESSTTQVADTSSAGTAPAQLGSADGATVGTAQDSQPTQQQDDPLAGIPSDDELKTLIEQNVPHAKSVAQLRTALEKRNSAYSELETKWKTFEPVSDRFTAPEELQQLVEMRESLLGWENDNGRLIPSTEKFIATLDPARAEYLFADLADGMSADGTPRMDRALKFIATDPERRANALRILGAVEPSAVAPQWQATDEQLSVVADDLKDTFKSLPYDTREALATNEPNFINDYLKREKVQNDLIADRASRDARDADQQQQFQAQLQQESAAAGNQYVDKLITDGLTTFHQSVVEQCNFIAPLDMANLPDGMTAEQGTAMNAQIVASNEAEAAQITSQIVSLINPQTRRYTYESLKKVGVIDDKLMAQIDAAAEAVGNNGRNYGQLLHQNSRVNKGYQPGPDVVPLNNEAQRNFKLLVHYANQIKGKLMEKRSQFFAMKATGHNAILNGVATSRPNANGGGYDPTTAAVQQPQGWMSRDEIASQFSPR